MKKIINILLLLICVFAFSSCDMTGKKEETPEEFVYTTPFTDETKLTKTWEGKEFIKDGIGKVTVVQNVDGDTTIFRSTSGYSFSTRYNGIDTPESTYKVEPWGFAAADFTKGKLKSAETIVLECENLNERTDSNGRYLAWVWYRVDETSDFRLLNLEIVENALAQPKGYSGSVYSDAFMTANEKAHGAKVRIYGETDPKYDASKIGASYSIKELRENFETLIVEEQNLNKGKVIRTEGVVTMKCGIGSGYIQSFDEATGKYWNIYVYGGFDASDLQVGREVYIQGKIGYYNGSLQITDLDRSNSGITALSPVEMGTSTENNNFHVENNVSVADLSKPELQGSPVTLSNLEVYRSYNTKDSQGKPTYAYTLYCRDQFKKEITIRIGEDVPIKIAGENNGLRITDGAYFVGRTLESVYAVVGWYSNLNTQETEYESNGVQLLVYSGTALVLDAE